MTLSIVKPPWTKTGKNIEKLIRKAIFEYTLLDDPKIAIALSGGKDSLTLLYFLSAISGRGIANLNLTAIHIEGNDPFKAKNDMFFLSSICKGLNIDFISVPSPKMPKNFDCYICSRIRRKLIFEKAKEKDISTIAFGHHKEDNIQTLLMNLFHKGEFAGILPKLKMYAYNITIIRPLIYVSESDIISFTRYYNIVKKTYTCPKEKDTRRSDIEKIIIKLEDIFPNIRKNLSLAAKNYGSNKAIKNSEKILESIKLKKKP